jgi:hypothetical protein
MWTIQHSRERPVESIPCAVPQCSGRVSRERRYQQTFEFCRRFQGVLGAHAARGRIPPKRRGIRHAEQRAKKRMSFRRLPRPRCTIETR